MPTNVPDTWLPLYGEFCAYIHRQTCEVCGRSDPEVAHVDGVAGKKLPGRPNTSRMRPRQGAAIFCAVPLCAECHREGQQSFHHLGQQAFAETHFGNEANLLALANRHQLQFFLGELIK